MIPLFEGDTLLGDTLLGDTLLGDTLLGNTPYEIEFLINFDIYIMIFYLKVVMSEKINSFDFFML